MGTRPLLFISRDADADWISAIAVGRVDDGLPADRWEPIARSGGWVLDEEGRRVGARLDGVAGADLNGTAFAALWDLEGPRFDAPSLGFHDVPMGAVIAGALERLEGRSTVNRELFGRALAAEDSEEALGWWGLCLEAGDLMGHYGLGYTYCALSGFADAFHHLSYYATLATHDVWTWCWLGRAALGLGETERAQQALRRALALERALGGEPQTDAAELLAGLE